MKYSLLLIFIFLTANVDAQEIDASWFLYKDVEYTQMNTFDPDTSFFSVEEFGLDQLWDFSNQPTNNLIDSTWFLDPSELVFKDSFPKANLAKKNNTPFYDWEYYYTVTEDTIYDRGSAYIRHVGQSVDSLALPFGNSDVVYMTSGFSLGDTIWGTDNMFSNLQFRGMGTVKTGSHTTFENCILFKSEVPFLDDITYYWYQSNLTKEVARYVPPESANPSHALTWMLSYEDNTLPPSSINSNNELSDIHLSTSQNSLLIKSDQDRQVQLLLYNINGQLIVTNNYALKEGENNFEFNLNSSAEVIPLVFLLVDKKTKAFKSFKVIRSFD